MVIVTLPFGEHAEYSIHVPNPQRGWPVPQIPGGFKNHPSFPRTKAEMISSLAEARGGCSPCWMLALGWGLWSTPLCVLGMVPCPSGHRIPVSEPCSAPGNLQPLRHRLLCCLQASRIPLLICRFALASYCTLRGVISGSQPESPGEPVKGEPWAPPPEPLTQSICGGGRRGVGVGWAEGTCIPDMLLLLHGPHLEGIYLLMPPNTWRTQHVLFRNGAVTHQWFSIRRMCLP